MIYELVSCETMAYKRLIGDLGEDLVVRYISNLGHSILNRNYLKRSGEIDIISKKDGIIHFLEVKTKNISVSHETDDTPDVGSISILNVSSDDYINFSEFPEENVHGLKKSRMARVIDEYLREFNFVGRQEFDVDIAAVLLDIRARKAKIRITPNVIL
jgi:putative endonuclease